jgi:hypothetical protein
MMSDSRQTLQTAPWTIIAPGLAIFVTVFIFNLLGDTVRDLMDPKQQRTNLRDGLHKMKLLMIRRGEQGDESLLPSANQKEKVEEN